MFTATLTHGDVLLTRLSRATVEELMCEVGRDLLLLDRELRTGGVCVTVTRGEGE
jgi:hypothetical protein